MKVLIAYATTEGQTRKISEWVGDWVRKKGHDIVVMDCAHLDESVNVADFQVFILAGSLHMEKHQPELERFVKRHLDNIRSAPSVFLSVSATASRKDEASQHAAKKCVQTFIERTGWIPTAWAPVGGAIKYTKYSFLVKLVMKRISASNGGPTDTSRDHELTDWVALESFLAEFFDGQAFTDPKDHASAASKPDTMMST